MFSWFRQVRFFDPFQVGIGGESVCVASCRDPSGSSARPIYTRGRDRSGGVFGRYSQTKAQDDERRSDALR